MYFMVFVTLQTNGNSGLNFYTFLFMDQHCYQIQQICTRKVSDSSFSPQLLYQCTSMAKLHRVPLKATPQTEPITLESCRRAASFAFALTGLAELY